MTPKSPNHVAAELPPYSWVPPSSPSKRRAAPIDLTQTGSPTELSGESLLPSTGGGRPGQHLRDMSRRKLSDATPVPNPASGYAGPSRPMSKPGGGKGFRPMNTLNGIDGTNPAHGRANNKTTYSKRDRPSGPIGTQRHNGQQVFLQHHPHHKTVTSPRESMSVTPPTKRRKMYSSHNEAVPTVEISDSEEDNVQGEHPTTEPVPARARSAIASRSPHSAASRQSGTTAFTLSQPVSEFSRTEQALQPKRSKPRKPRTNESCAGQSEVRFNVPAVPVGSLSHGDVLQTMPRSSGRRHEGIAEDGKTSKHFRPGGSPSKMRINESTIESYDRRANELAADSSVDKDLRQFRPATTHGPRHVVQYEGSEDELAAPNISKKRDRESPGKHTQPRTNTARLKCQSGDYLLNFFQTYDSCQGQSLLRPTDDRRKFRIVSRDNDDGEKILHILHLNQVNKVRADDTHRMRLTGAITAKGDQYWYDLEFEDAAAFRQFRDNHAFPECSSITRFIKDPDYMTNLFNKPLERRNKARESAAVDEALPPSHDHNTQQSSSKAPLLIQNLKPTGSNETASKIDDLRKPAPSAQSQLRSVRTTRARAPVHDVEDLETEREVSKFSKQVGFGKPWPNQLNYGVQNGFLARRKCTINFDDLPKLDEEEFLNDSLVNFYLLYLYNELKVSITQVYFFNTYFFEALTKNTKGRNAINYDAVKSWTRRDYVFDYDHIVVPINENFHWYLAIICNVKNIKRVAAGIPADDSQDLDLTTIEAHSLVPVVEPNHNPDTKDQNETNDTKKTLDPLINTGTEPDDENLFEEERRLSLVDPEKETSPDQLPAIELRQSNEQPFEDATANSTALNAQSKDELSNLTPRQFKQQARGKSRQKATGPRRDPEKPTIIILDSLGGAHGNATRALRDWLKAEGLDKRGMDVELETKAVYAKPQHIPMQSNFSDCGLYVLGYAKKFFADPDDFKNRLLKGEMSTGTDWPDMDASKMRADIRGIIIGLYNAQQEVQRKAHKAKKALKAKSTLTPPSESEPVQQAPDVVNGAERAPRANSDAETSPESASPRPSISPVRRSGSPFASKTRTNPDQPKKTAKARPVVDPSSEAITKPMSALSNSSPAKRFVSPKVRVSTSPKVNTSSYVQYDDATERAVQRQQQHTDLTDPSQNQRGQGKNDRVSYAETVESASRQPREHSSPPQSRIRSGSHDDPISLDDSQDLDAPVQRRSQSARKPLPEIIELDRSQEYAFLPASHAKTSSTRSPHLHHNTPRQAVGQDDSIQGGAVYEWCEGRDTTLAIKASLADAQPHLTDDLYNALMVDPQASASIVEIPDTQPMDLDDEHDDTVVPESSMEWEPDEG